MTNKRQLEIAKALTDLLVVQRKCVSTGDYLEIDVALANTVERISNIVDGITGEITVIAETREGFRKELGNFPYRIPRIQVAKHTDTDVDWKDDSDLTKKQTFTVMTFEFHSWIVLNKKALYTEI